MAEAPTGDELLTPNDVVNVLEEILEAQDQSFVLGLKLKLPQYVVDGIYDDHSQPRERLLQVLIEFTKLSDPRPTWRAIVDALKTPAVNLPQLAMRVEAAHFPDPTATRDHEALPETSPCTATTAGSDTTSDIPPVNNLKTSTPSTQTSNARVSSQIPYTSEYGIDTAQSVPSTPNATSQASKPTLPALLNLRTSSGNTVNILQEIGKNYSKLGLLLLNDNTGAVTSSITHEHYQNAEEINQEILRRWLQGQGKGPVSWSTLISVLRDIGLTELAKIVQESPDSSGISSEHTFVPPSVAAIQSPVNTHPPQQRSDSQLSTTEFSDTATDNENDMLQLPQGPMTIKTEIREFEKRFNALKKSTRECLEKLRVLVKRVADVLTSLPADGMDNAKKFLKNNKTELYQASDHYELFGTMNFHWNYQNYHLLDHLIREFDLEGVQGEMKTYKEDLQKFRKKTPLKLFCQSQKQKRIKPPPDFHEVVAELNLPDNVTLEVVEEFRQGYAGHYNLRDFAILLGTVLDGSFSITWFIPASIVEKLKVKVPTSILKKYSVTKLEVAGECVYSKFTNEMADLRDNPELRPFVLSNVTLTGKKIGHGSYGSVEEVEIPGGICAAKKLHDIFQDGSEIPQDDIRRVSTQFVEECKLMSTLHHPNIVQFLGVYFFPDLQLPALVMERLATDLHKLLSPQKPPPDAQKPFIPLSLKCSILQNVASALAYLHQKTPPIVHRDLSARNVLLTSGMVAKIADLGMARIFPKDLRTATTMTKAPGSNIYMPPEALAAKSGENERSKYDASIDIFSFGVVAIFTLSQTLPDPLIEPTYRDDKKEIAGRSELQRRDKYMQIIYRELGQEHPLVKMIGKCLEFPEERPDISEVVGLLEEARAEEGDDLMKMNKLELIQSFLAPSRNQEARAEHSDDENETLQTKSRQEINSANTKQSPHSATEQLTVQCYKRRRAPCQMSRGSATTDDQYAYFTPCSSNSVFRYEWSTAAENWDEITQCPHRHSGLVIIDGELTAVGGYDGSRPTNEVLTYSSQQKKWVKKHQPMNTARFQTAVVSTKDGKYVFAIGGQSYTWTATVEVLDVKSGEWHDLTNLPRALTLPSATICGNELRVIGGKTKGYWCSLPPLLSSDQPKTLEWIELPRLPINGSTAATLSQHLLIIGGDITKEQVKFSKLLGCFDPDVNSIHQLVNGEWVMIGCMSDTRSECFVVSLSRDELLIVGGVEERSVERCVVLKQ